MAELSEKLKEKAKLELNETDDIREDCIVQLQVLRSCSVQSRKTLTARKLVQ